MRDPHTTALRILKGLLAAGFLMLLIGVAAFYLASLDHHPKDHRFMVWQLSEAQNG